MKRIPIGVENFKRMIDEDFYYIDKSLLIKDIMSEEFVLYARPRRFGKTLNMSMLYYFFSNKEKENAYLFDHLEISKDKEVMKHQNQYPVIFLTLKDMKSSSMDSQKEQFSTLIQDIIEQYSFILDSNHLSSLTKKRLNHIYNDDYSSTDLVNSLMYISHALKQYYQKDVIILIDEYDVPLQCAYQNQYYDEMAEFLRGVLSKGLKTNDAVFKGILTGCLRVSKESIFTGLNHIIVRSIFDITSSQSFGFTQAEIKQLLTDYHLENNIDEVKEWYDGYLFGETEIYNPWSTLMYVDRKLQKESLQPISFWANTSGNDIVVDYIKDGNEALHEEFEQLMQGKTIKKEIKPELTYRDMDNITNIYSFLLMTGYLKINKQINQYTYELIIPNKEVYEIYEQSFMSYFEQLNLNKRSSLINALNDEDEAAIENIITDVLKRSISYDDEKEMFYHGLLVGLLGTSQVESNRESRNGRPDIIVYPHTLRGKVIIIECKYTDIEENLIAMSQCAADQIVDLKYKAGIEAKGYKQMIGYGIAFCKKQCFITKSK